jgi:hypothetical protein
MGATNNIWRKLQNASTNGAPIPSLEVEETIFDVGDIVAFCVSQTVDVDDNDL